MRRLIDNTVLSVLYYLWQTRPNRLVTNGVELFSVLIELLPVPITTCKLKPTKSYIGRLRVW